MIGGKPQSSQSRSSVLASVKFTRLGAAKPYSTRLTPTLRRAIEKSRYEKAMSVWRSGTHRMLSVYETFVRARALTSLDDPWRNGARRLRFVRHDLQRGRARPRHEQDDTRMAAGLCAWGRGCRHLAGRCAEHARRRTSATKQDRRRCKTAGSRRRRDKSCLYAASSAEAWSGDRHDQILCDDAGRDRRIHASRPDRRQSTTEPAEHPAEQEQRGRHRIVNSQMRRRRLPAEDPEALGPQPSLRGAVATKQSRFFSDAGLRSLSSGAHSRDPLAIARNDDQIATCRPISTTWSLGRLKKSLTWTALRSITANSRSCHPGNPMPSSRPITVSCPT